MSKPSPSCCICIHSCAAFTAVSRARTSALEIHAGCVAPFFKYVAALLRPRGQPMQLKSPCYSPSVLINKKSGSGSCGSNYRPRHKTIGARASCSCHSRYAPRASVAQADFIEHLAAVLAGAKALGAEVTDCGIFTTPQLHFVVRCKNDPSYGVATIEGYNMKLAKAFRALCTSAGLFERISRTPTHLVPGLL